MIELLRYVTPSGQDPIGRWLGSLADVRVRARITTRLERLAAGHYGDCKSVGSGVWELRIDIGPGYRIYYAQAGKSCLLLLCGGNKQTQRADIKKAIDYWNDYQQRAER